VILIDTSILSRLFRRRRPGVEEQRLKEAFTRLMSGDEPLGIPAIVLQEALSGLKSRQQFVLLREQLLGAFTILPATLEDHLEAARLKNECLAHGVNVSGIDCLIAAICINGRHSLFTLDDDFKGIARHAPLRLFTPRGRS
jgi:hypothetical protein